MNIVDSASFSGSDNQKPLSRVTRSKPTGSTTPTPKSTSVPKKKSQTVHPKRTDTSITKSFAEGTTTKPEDNTSVNSAASDDSELKIYVVEFKKKVEKKYVDSMVNKNYKFPYVDKIFDSEESIGSLLDVSTYNLFEQNNKEDKDETEQLVDFLQEIGQLDKCVLKNELRYFFSKI